MLSAKALFVKTWMPKLSEAPPAFAAMARQYAVELADDYLTAEAVVTKAMEEAAMEVNIDDAA